ncbi:hypothetical protein T265_11003 [Opisthorchis viverrini]|uniref:C2H2-type domain-containing protein n=1 Tax=Opisthorchis viverrini TaxID=6198 RepID=A0A074ZB31_OPIVI|nr:hypothetical protein T265_11003 [Opisthorchis viverrini]KER20440.1 hypothetical protein T265_11003 [Opisthorchis viverrini]
MNHEIKNAEKTPKTEHAGTTCGEELVVSVSDLKIHASTHDISASIMCEMCGIILKHLLKQLWNNRDDHASDGAESGQSHSVLNLEKRSEIQRHTRCHSAEENCLCSTCGQVFPNSGALQKDNFLHHDKAPMEQVTKHECAVCKRWSEGTRNLKRHSVVHTKQRPFVCVLCAKAYSQFGALQLHQSMDHHMQARSTAIVIHVTGDDGPNGN